MNTSIKKAVFPVAGMGTRFLPATKANPKEMMPVVDKPLIQYAVEEALSAGIRELIFVTSNSKRAIEDHFDTHFELETKLEAQGKKELLNIVRSVKPANVSCIYIRQPEALGLGHAILCAKQVVGNEPFAVLLADDLIDSPSHNSCMQQMVAQYQQLRASVIGVEPIDLKDSDKYGIVGLEDPLSFSQQVLEAALQRIGKINQIIEKPKAANAPSNFAVIGRYILSNNIFPHLEQVKPGRNGEIQLTDAIASMLAEEAIYALQFSGTRFDCGSKLGYLQAIVAYGLAHPEVGAEFKNFLDEL